jgi:chromosome segregation ATPase
MTEATLNSVPGTSGGSAGAPPKGGQAGASKAMYMALAVAIVAAGAGWSQVYSANKALEAAEAEIATAKSDIDAMKGQFTAVGLDASTPQQLGVSIAAQKRVLTDLENALVAKSAAARARDAQIAKAAGMLGTVEAASAAATAAESEASATFATLDEKNRFLTGRVAELESAAVSWQAAAGARRTELDGLIAEVKASEALIADAALWRAEGAALTAAQAKLARDVTDLENKVVSLTSAVSYRQGELSKAMVALSTAQADERQALMTTLDLRAESSALSKSIVTLGAERERVAAALTDVNNRFVPALAAVGVREKQLQGLVAEVAEQEAARVNLAAANADLDARLAAADARLSEITEVAGAAAEHLRAIEDLLGAPTVQAALKTE